MKKKLISVCLGLCMIFSFMGCGTNADTYKTYTFSVETGDSIEISLDTSENYDITSEIPFVISCNDDVLSQGIFITADNYEEYKKAVSSDVNAVLMETEVKDGNEYIFWSYNNSEFNYAILIADSNTGIILGNDVSKESAQECFERIEITLK